MPLCCQVLISVWPRAREVEPLAWPEVGVVELVVGPGSDLSEEPAVQDVEPVTLDLESCLIVLPDPPHSLAVGWASAISER
jgi:hypothetical protein